ncbi:hypothetical protein K438DRAFT_1864268 [Mycena galopus ATCC 62051]|nr:hypothetical protein K438DRAFT_1864268 [Mycena galopus ATCC 62051]
MRYTTSLTGPRSCFSACLFFVSLFSKGGAERPRCTTRGKASTREMGNGCAHLTSGRTYYAYSAPSPAVCLRRVCLRDDECIGGTRSALSAYHTGAGRRYGEIRRHEGRGG